MYKKHYIAIGALSTILASSVVIGLGCGSTGGNGDTAGQGGAGHTGSASSNSGAGSPTSSGAGDGGGINFDAGISDAPLTPDSACASQSATATLTKKPVDVIIVIDNSGSMTEEIVGVQKNINQNFATIIEKSGLDYRVIMVTRHGKAASGQSVCVEAPLSGIPAGGCTNPPAQPVNNPPKFYHYSTEIASTNSWCKVLDTFNAADEFSLAPNGWKDWLRPDAFKAFIEITDDRVSCGAYNDGNTAAGATSAAAKFDQDLIALSPQFGDAMGRNYIFYSIVAMAYNNPATMPYSPMDPIITGKCPTAATAGMGHQALSILTGGLRFPICDTTSYDAVFQAIAAGVISGAKISCDFAVPPAPAGQTIDPASVVVQYTMGGMGNPTDFTQVPDANSCMANSFYLANNQIHLCPDACTLVQADDKAAVSVLFSCLGGLN